MHDNILGDPGATSRDDAIFSGESLLQELKSPWELILTEPVPDVVKFRPADWTEKYFFLPNRSAEVSPGKFPEAFQLLMQTFAQKYCIVPASSPWVSEDGTTIARVAFEIPARVKRIQL